MSKEQKKTLLIAVTFLMTFLCLGATFVLQLRMQETLESLAELPNQTVSAKESAAAESEPAAVSESTEPPLSLEVSAVAAAQTDGSTANTSAATRVTAAKTQTTETTTAPPRPTEISAVLVINKNSKKIHSPTCSYVKNMKEENRGEISSAELDAYLAQGYTLCQRCKGVAS